MVQTFMILSSSTAVTSEGMEPTPVSLLANSSDPAIEEDMVARLSGGTTKCNGHQMYNVQQIYTVQQKSQFPGVHHEMKRKNSEFPWCLPFCPCSDKDKIHSVHAMALKVTLGRRQGGTEQKKRRKNTLNAKIQIHLLSEITSNPQIKTKLHTNGVILSKI